MLLLVGIGSVLTHDGVRGAGLIAIAAALLLEAGFGGRAARWKLLCWALDAIGVALWVWGSVWPAG